MSADRATAPAPGTASVTVRAPAKVNVQLAVGGRRADGFHALATVFHAVSLYDEVTASTLPASASGEQGTVRITVSGADAAQVPTDGDNLAARAATLLARRAGVPGAVHLHIAKDIPVAGGMAGGSADAAAALLACDRLWGLDTPRATLLELAAELGSDVPFSLVGGTALGTGRGERLTPVEVGGTLHWVFAVADGGLSTPAVYAECDRLRRTDGGGDGEADVPAPEAAPELLAALRAGDAKAVGAALANDLQPAALSLRPALAATLRAGREAGALGALVSGSGPTCAFLAEDAEAAGRLATALEASGTCRAARTATGEVPGAVLLAAADSP
ncbi:4-(cytidine 5'-diphospho)-2-C-methyl-D-erythritol kinase [Allostreptomyces psammosilenae]|uniref:4-diphosphocytidyl-2-C-methyl-D-erythritol kinase n=1 Tax=Allostreptomyces psammosilenae TaxID=1892865 RepID=A0A853A332_9ACTN|nr:4-(cytidine 5'-diphospho)-2-C-methyl-D-erythritol kinase [Allostreptomyces psammosilenae]NYI07880.1 4-diphosphocytidyl-2-C-methyl-D-erythritol kinase [Allostreptomyces psammosilenae]